MEGMSAREEIAISAEDFIVAGCAILRAWDSLCILFHDFLEIADHVLQKKLAADAVELALSVVGLQGGSERI